MSFDKARPDGCEWNPDEDREAWADDQHHQTTPATVSLVADGLWHLCEARSRLPRFKRFRVRRPIHGGRT